MLLLICVLLPLAAGCVLRLVPRPGKRLLRGGAAAVSCLTALLMLYAALWGPEAEWAFPREMGAVGLLLRLDRAGKGFWLLTAAVCMPIVLFSMEFMEKDRRDHVFFARLLAAFGALALAGCAGNLLTLTLSVLLLAVLFLLLAGHTRDRDGFRAGTRCARCLLPGALLALISAVGLALRGLGAFQWGGPAGAAEGATVVFALLGFVGFGALTGLLPLTGWMADVTLAPAPVSALLHALGGGAGVLAVMRLLYCALPAGTLAGWPRTALMILCAATALYGEVRMLRTADVEMRLAWSTVSNLSFALIGLSLLTGAGLAAGLAHAAYHALAKIPLFFCTGIILLRTGRITVREMHGLGKHLPWAFGAFTLAGMSLMGMPPLVGFVSKYALITAAFSQGGTLEIFSAVIMAVSTVFTAADIFTVVFPAFCGQPSLKEGKTLWDCGALARTALILLCALLLAASFLAGPAARALTALGGGIGV